MSNHERFPDHVRDADLDTKVAVLYERVGALDDRVRTLIKIGIGVISTIFTAMVMLLFGVAAGWFGPSTPIQGAQALLRAFL